MPMRNFTLKLQKRIFYAQNFCFFRMCSSIRVLWWWVLWWWILLLIWRQPVLLLCRLRRIVCSSSWRPRLLIYRSGIEKNPEILSIYSSLPQIYPNYFISSHQNKSLLRRSVKVFHRQGIRRRYVVVRVQSHPRFVPVFVLEHGKNLSFQDTWKYESIN